MRTCPDASLSLNPAALSCRSLRAHCGAPLPGFYDEMNRVFMAAEDWQLGDSLDALNDMLYGGYGALHGAGSVRLRWLAMASPLPPKIA
ncbi:hypothetical protein DPM13_00970 [Paracoccus mutanolyticus]|uniref:Barstar (barnase inhibitor) domain-containing protein n=2 Tax=Paracoccus mutanolyticus TaxID=1499308 RepID=A0ABM6WP44_9RHOB|nr:hypothetical protein DPM13_00970 [Paracoccus mutanolyticus]